MPWAAVAGAGASYLLNSTDPLGGKSGGGGGTGGGASGPWGQSPDTIASTIAALSNAQNANPTDADKQQLESLKRNNEIAQSMWQRYQDVYKPLQDQVVNDANTIDSQQNQDRVAGVANADVTGAFDRTRQANLERLRSMGVNPNSGAFIEANSRLAGQEAAANAGAQNTARTNLINTGRQYRAGVAGQGTAIPGQSMAGLTSGASGFGSAASGIRTGRTADNSAMGAWLKPVIGGIGNWMNGRSNNGGYVDTSASMNVPDYTSGLDPSAGGTYNSGAWADGGPVRGPQARGVVSGPGSGTSDSIPVAVRGPGGVSRGHLSDGEFVVPSDVVKAKGTEFFNKLIETYHTPVLRRGVRG